MPVFIISLAVSACLFLSGAASLIYEVLWIKLMGLFVGNSHWAYASVVAGFMAGLSIGSFLGGRASGSKNARGLIKYFALIQFGIAAGGIATYFSASVVSKYLVAWVSGAPSFIEPYIWFILSFLLVLIPCILIGASFPVITQWYAGNVHEPAKNISVLYAVNTAGAVAGIFAAGFYLVRLSGLRNSFFAAALLNAVCALIALALYGVCGKEPRGKPQSTSCNADPVAAPVFFFAGAASMICQIAWSRLLILIIGSSTYAYSVILLVFIAGLSIGSALYGKISRSLKPGFFTAGAAFAFIGILIAVSSFYTEYLFYVFLKLVPFAAVKLLPIEAVYVVICSAMIFLPTVFMGAAYPIFISAVAAKSGRVGENVGLYTGINTFGSIAGILAAVFLLISSVGIENTLMAAGILYALCAAALIYFSGTRKSRLAAFAAVGAVFLLNTARKSWDPLILSSGVFIYAPEYRLAGSFGGFKKLLTKNEVLYHKDGNSSTVTVLQSRTDERFLRINGKTDASKDTDMATQLLLAHLPRFFHRGMPLDVMVVGLGSGSTAGAVSLDPNIKTIDCIEMEKAVSEAAVMFSDVNRGVLGDERLNMVYTDARHYLAGARRKYDIIISEPSNPWISGISSLYTMEAFKMVLDGLKEGGIFSQWLHGYSMSEADFKTICATFANVFPHAVLFSPARKDFILLGSKEPFVFDFPKVERFILENPAVAEDLSLCEFPNTFTMLAVTFCIGGEDLKSYVAGSGILKDDKNTLEYSAPRNLHGGEQDLIDANLAAAKNKTVLDNIIGLDITDSERVLLYNQSGEAFMRRKDAARAEEWFAAANKINPRDARSIVNLGRIASVRNKDIQAEQLYLKAIKIDPDYALAYFHLAKLYEIQGFEQKAREYYKKGSNK